MQMSTKKNRLKQIRMDSAMEARVAALVERSGLSESDIIRLTMAAGLEQIEAGKFNPLAVSEKKVTYGKGKT